MCPVEFGRALPSDPKERERVLQTEKEEGIRIIRAIIAKKRNELDQGERYRISEQLFLAEQ